MRSLPLHLVTVVTYPGASPRRTPLHAPSLAASPASSGRVAGSRCSFAGCDHCPFTLSPSLLTGGLRPAGPPYTRPRSPLRRLAPVAWLARGARSRDAITAPSPCHRLYLPGGFAPPDPPTRALARRFAGSLRSRGSVRCAHPRRSSSPGLEDGSGTRAPA